MTTPDCPICLDEGFCTGCAAYVLPVPCRLCHTSGLCQCQTPVRVGPWPNPYEGLDEAVAWCAEFEDARVQREIAAGLREPGRAA